MDLSLDLPDPTDWHATKFEGLSAFESELQCKICKELFDTPMITECSHTFCSICIRRCVVVEAKCPTCREKVEESRLRRNATVASLVELFQAVRPALLKAAKDVPVDNGNSARSLKRKADQIEESDNQRDLARPLARRTRSQRNGVRQVEVEKSGRDNEYEDEKDGLYVISDSESEPGIHEGFAECPMCEKKMKVELVFGHLDNCRGKQSPKPTTTSRIFSNGPISKKAFPTEKLARLNYALLKEPSLRKKLSDAGIPSGGNKQTMMKRYDEWVNLVNSSIDSPKPQSTKELLDRLKIWERSQNSSSTGLSMQNDGESIMGKSFDHRGWSSKHNPDFQQLTATALKSAKSGIRSAPSGNDRSATESEQPTESAVSPVLDRIASAQQRSVEPEDAAI